MDYQSSTESQQIHNTDKTLKSSSTRRFSVSVTELENDKDLNANNQPTIDAPDLIIFDIEKNDIINFKFAKNNKKVYNDDTKNTPYGNLNDILNEQLDSVHEHYQLHGKKLTTKQLVTLKHDLITITPAEPQFYMSNVAVSSAIIAMVVSVIATSILNQSDLSSTIIGILLIVIPSILLMYLTSRLKESGKHDYSRIKLINYQLEKVNKLLEEKSENQE